MEPNRNDPNKNKDSKKPKGGFWLALIITVALILLVNTVFNAVRNGQYTKTSLSDFLDAKANGQLEEVELQ